MSKLLEVERLCKSFLSGDQRLQVLQNLCLEVESGDMVAVTGVSGSGKSTLLHLIGGMESPDSGTIRISGRDLSSLDPGERAEYRNSTVGFLFQSHHLLPEFNAFENVMMPLLLRGRSQTDAHSASLTLLRDVQLEQRAHHRPGELSGGERQRVALARALVGNPQLLLADEPTGNLDPKTGHSVALLVQSLHNLRSLTSIIVTHNEQLAELCNRRYRLEDGLLRSG